MITLRNEHWENVPHDPARPFLFIDVDGALNTLPNKQAETVSQEEQYVTDQTATLTMNTGRGQLWSNPKQVSIRYSTQMVEDLNQIATDADAQIVYLTQWLSEAMFLLNPLLGLKAVGFLNWNTQSDLGQEAKAAALDSFYSYNKLSVPYVWVDDVVTQHEAVHGTHPHSPRHNLGKAIQTNPKYGITKPQMNDIQAFLTR